MWAGEVRDHARPQRLPYPREQHRPAGHDRDEPTRSVRGTRAALRGSPRAAQRERSETGTFFREKCLQIGNQHRNRVNLAQGTPTALEASNEEEGRAGHRCTSRDRTNPHNPNATHAPSRTLRADFARRITPRGHKARRTQSFMAKSAEHRSARHEQPIEIENPTAIPTPKNPRRARTKTNGPHEPPSPGSASRRRRPKFPNCPTEALSIDDSSQGSNSSARESKQTEKKK